MALPYSPPSSLSLTQEGFVSRNANENGEEKIEVTVANEKECTKVSSKSLNPSFFERAAPIDEISTPPVIDSIPAAWRQVDMKCQGTFNVHSKYWWNNPGLALAILLDNAGYSYATQVLVLDFFARCIAPRLGMANKSGVERWKSFMTDDHSPIELSWDWHTGCEAPTIRFSIEPVGQEAGTAKDPRNELVASEFLGAVVKDLPAINMQWFYHFRSYFGLGTKHHLPAAHQTQVFWAFDLDEKDITGKAYFFPEYRAHATHKTSIQVISEAIEAAPSCTPDNLSALYSFQEFVREHAEVPLEMDMLAIDLVEPLQSRLKIYIRTRETSFKSVREAMTLGGRFTNGDTTAGLQSLRHLWDSLFDQQGVPESSPLPASKHRTAGILYYVEIRLGSKTPKVKIYIPVRHYAQNDWQIIGAVSDFVFPVQVGANSTANLNKKQTPSAFRAAMCSIFGEDSLRRQRGGQTYVGCSIQQGGKLRVVSYINPK